MAIHRDMIVTTTGTLEGYEIKAYLGVISTQIVAGTNIFSDIAAECVEDLHALQGKPVVVSFLEALKAIAEANDDGSWEEASMLERFKKAVESDQDE